MPLGQMQIDRGHFEVAMTEQKLNATQIGAGIEQMRGETMP